MGKSTLASISRTIGGHTEITELSKLSDLALQEIHHLTAKVRRLYDLTFLTREQSEQIHTTRNDWRQNPVSHPSGD
jgi:hypothetical protein